MNGTKQLIDSLFNGNEDAFIEHFVKSCLFLPKGIVQEKANELLDNIKNNREVPIRYGKNGIKEFFAPNKKALGNKKEKELKNIANNEGLFFKEGNVKVFLDGNGNQSVVNSIKEKTGYIINTFNRDFFNYTLSHIWAKTTHNPYYFSSLWNVVIIPDYLNYIMDKPRKQDKVNGKIQNLIKAICIELYQPETLMNGKVKVEKPNEKFLELAKKVINNKWIHFLGKKKGDSETRTIFIDKDFENINKLGNKEFAFQCLKLMQDYGLLEDNLAILTDAQECKENLGHYFPILLEKNSNNSTKDKNGRNRYYTEPFFQYNGKEYYVTNDWYEKKEGKASNRDNRPIFIDWIYSLLNE